MKAMSRFAPNAAPMKPNTSLQEFTHWKSVGKLIFSKGKISALIIVIFIKYCLDVSESVLRLEFMNEVLNCSIGGVLDAWGIFNVLDQILKNDLKYENNEILNWNTVNGI